MHKNKIHVVTTRFAMRTFVTVFILLLPCFDMVSLLSGTKLARTKYLFYNNFKCLFNLIKDVNPLVAKKTNELVWFSANSLQTWLKWSQKKIFQPAERLFSEFVHQNSQLSFSNGIYDLLLGCSNVLLKSCKLSSKLHSSVPGVMISWWRTLRCSVL